MSKTAKNSNSSAAICSYCQSSAEVVRVLELIGNKARVENSEGRQFEVLTDLVLPVKPNDKLWVDAGVGLGHIL